MTAFSDLLKEHFPEGWSNRDVARRADELGVKLSRATVDTYTGEAHGRPTEQTMDAFHRVLGIPLTKLRQAAGAQRGELAPWVPPAEADRMTRRQRSAVNELIRSMVTISAPTDDDLFDVAADWAQRAGIPRVEFARQFSELIRQARGAGGRGQPDIEGDESEPDGGALFQRGEP